MYRNKIMGFRYEGRDKDKNRKSWQILTRENIKKKCGQITV